MYNNVTMLIDIKVPQSGKTFYGDPVISFKDILEKESSALAIRDGFYAIFKEIIGSGVLLEETIHHCVESISRCSSLLDYEHDVRNFLVSNGIIEKYNERKRYRAELRSTKVINNIVGETVLDLGCGSGKIGAMISNAGFNVSLADVYKNTNISSLDLPFFEIKDGDSLPFKEESFDNVVILSMLHHTQDPVHTLQECSRVLKTGGRLNMIETVYGISKESDSILYDTNDKSFKSLTYEQQRHVTMFFDYFANHVLDAFTKDPVKYVPVPFNFTTPENLEGILDKIGFELKVKEHFGIYPFSYVYHIHYVYHKKDENIRSPNY